LRKVEELKRHTSEHAIYTTTGDYSETIKTKLSWVGGEQKAWGYPRMGCVNCKSGKGGEKEIT